MKKILFAIALLGMNSSYSNAQLNQTERYVTTGVHIQTNIERYKIDFELVDESIISDSKEILLSLNLDLIEDKRLEDVDQVFMDPTTQIEILVYSYSKVALRKESNSSNLNQTK